MTAIRVIFALLAAPIVASCTEDVSTPFERGPEDHDHVATRILPSPVRLGASVEWGDVGPLDVRASDGSVAVYDRQAGSIFVLQDGSDPVSFGRRGEGPGELDLAGPVVFTEERVFVFGAARTSVFAASGEFLTSTLGLRTSAAFEWTDSSVASLAWDVRRTPLGVGHTVLIWDQELRDAPDTLFSTWNVEGVDPDSLHHGGDLFGNSEVGLFATSPRGTSAVFRIDPETSVATSWAVIPRSQVDWEPIEWARYMHDGARDGLYLEAMPQMREVLQRVLARPPLSETPQFLKPLVPKKGASGLDPSHRVWAMMGVPYGQRTTIDVFSEANGRIATLRAPDHIFERVVLKGRWLVGVTLDEYDRPSIWRYDISDTLNWLDGLETSPAG